MILIADANIIVSALIKNSATRKLIIKSSHSLFTPDFVFEEIDKHIKLISKKNSLSVEENRRILSIISDYIETVSKEVYLSNIPMAEEIIGQIDYKDIPYVALALTITNDGIWTEDDDFQRQKKIKVWRTKDLLRLEKF